MRREPVFFSFDYRNDVMRVQLVRQMGVLDGNQPVSSPEWESIQRTGDAAVKAWIDNTMRYKRCVVVLIGADTANRPWVQYEIARAWDTGKGLVGVYIHNLSCPRNGICSKGPNPFDRTFIAGVPMSRYVRTYDPDPFYAYSAIASGLQGWVATAIDEAARR
jgi:hypothetical protein